MYPEFTCMSSYIPTYSQVVPVSCNPLYISRFLKFAVAYDQKTPPFAIYLFVLALHSTTGLWRCRCRTTMLPPLTGWRFD